MRSTTSMKKSRTSGKHSAQAKCAQQARRKRGDETDDRGADQAPAEMKNRPQGGDQTDSIPGTSPRSTPARMRPGQQAQADNEFVMAGQNAQRFDLRQDAGLDLQREEKVQGHDDDEADHGVLPRSGGVRRRGAVVTASRSRRGAVALVRTTRCSVLDVDPTACSVGVVGAAERRVGVVGLMANNVCVAAAITARVPVRGRSRTRVRVASSETSPWGMTMRIARGSRRRSGAVGRFAGDDDENFLDGVESDGGFDDADGMP